MAISDPAIRFNFDFADLRRAPPGLCVLGAQLEPLPAGAAAMAPQARPRWLPPLLPVFRSGDPLRVCVLSAEAPVWAWRLRSSLAALLACAGGRTGVQALEWHDGFAIGPPGFDRLPVTPHAVVVGAECDPASVSTAARLILPIERGRCFLVMHGDVPALDRSIGLDTTQVVRFPAVGKSDLVALARGVHPGLTSGPFGRACFGLAQAIVARYRQLEQ